MFRHVNEKIKNILLLSHAKILSLLREPIYPPTLQTMDKSKEYIQTASWCDIFDRVRRIYENEFEINLPSIFEGHSPCRIANLRQDSRGNIQVCFNWCGAKRHILAHLLTYVAYHELRISPSASQQISHLCHNHQCHEPSHLVVESSRQNHSRKNCVGYVWSATYQDWIPVCNHKPRCLTARREENIK